MSRWGILSTGVIAKKFAATLNAMGEEAVLAAVASRDLSKAKAFAAEYAQAGSCSTYGSYQELLADPNVDIVYVATPNSLHAKNVLECIRHRKHVLCEKPLTTSAAEGEALFQSAKDAGVFLMEGMWIRHLPLLQKLQELIASGTIGQVKHLRADYGFIAQGARLVRKMEPSLGGGALLDVGVYNLAFARMIMGAEPESIQKQVNYSEFGTDDFSVLLLRYPGGRTAVLTAAIGIAMPTEGVVYGEKGCIRLPNYQQAQTLTVTLYDGRSYTIEMPFEHNGFEYQIREAQRCISQGLCSSDRLTPEDTLAVLREMEAVLK